MADEYGLLSNSLLSDEELLVELARARKEAELHSCPDLAGGAHVHTGEDAATGAGDCACARMRELEHEVEVRLARRQAPPRRIARAG